jgi:hypothetical protein
MAGIGPAPKPKEQRRNRTPPLRSEWVDLEPLKEPVLPLSSSRWSGNARRMWNVWRQDPVTTQWGPADVQYARELCRLYEKLPYAEQRQRMDALGLTPKGKRDLRWRTPAEVKTIAEQAPVKRLRVVEQEAKRAEA